MIPNRKEVGFRTFADVEKRSLYLYCYSRAIKLLLRVSQFLLR